MKAYCIVYEFIDNPEMFDQYRKQVMPTIEAYGGRFLVRGGKFTVLEGAPPCERIAVLEFPSRKAAEDWYHSPAYQKILPLRLDATRCSFVIADGID
ncbi:MAG TPA: DUF1330 domain-containing protein [Alphaproteobacteria bacterium]|nr:DUF1330 domain-containing protein [Alphaproteobacteria bacterium]